MPKLSSSWIQISTHALREEGDTEGTDFCSFLSISTHALREEGDRSHRRRRTHRRSHFYPRPPRGGRQAADTSQTQPKEISTHALREEGDCPRASGQAWHGYFYPRPPRGGRPAPFDIALIKGFDFYPRPPRGGRPPWRSRTHRRRHVYPRPPRGGRPISYTSPIGAVVFLPTPSARRATWMIVGS